MELQPNVLVLGSALELLFRLPSGMIDLVYLDPPWPEARKNSEVLTSDDYYDFIYNVLYQSKRVLKESGNIFFFSNPELNTDFNLLLKDVFGGHNYVTDFIVPKRHRASGFTNSHDTIICYRKGENQILNNRIIRVPDQEIERLYPFIDERGRYQTASPFINSSAGQKPNLWFEWHGVVPSDGKCWRYTKDRLEDLEKKGLIKFSDQSVRVKRYVTEEDYLIPVGTIWSDLSTTEAHSAFGAAQSLQMLRRILLIGSKTDSVILDPFCGSGSMVQAAFELSRGIIASDISDFAIATTKKRIEQSGHSISLVTKTELNSIPSHNRATIKRRLTREEDEIIELIKKGESTNLEFKESAVWNNYSNTKDATLIQNIYKAITAFANSPVGGTILIGVKDDHSFISLEKDFLAADPSGTEDKYGLYLNNKIRAELGASIISRYIISFHVINDCTICRIDITPSAEPIFYQRKFYIRNNNQSIDLVAEEFYRVLQARKE
jgi:adenine-specific DNA-methyltransferase